jgi:predicted transglutaminase-like protease
LNSRYPFTKSNFSVFIVLVLIIIIGIIGIPFGDPRFIIYAILLELSYITLAVLVAKGYRKPLYACILIAILIIIGNSFVTAHIHRIMTLERPLNTVVLIVGGYILQFFLILTSTITLRFSNKSLTV